MKLLLDTHAFLWWVAASGELSRKSRSAVESARNECFVSVASGWEIAIKASLGKLVDSIADELRRLGHRAVERPDPAPRLLEWSPHP